MFPTILFLIVSPLQSNANNHKLHFQPTRGGLAAKIAGNTSIKEIMKKAAIDHANDLKGVPDEDKKSLATFKRVRLSSPTNLHVTVRALERLVNFIRESPGENPATLRAYEVELEEWKKLLDK